MNSDNLGFTFVENGSLSVGSSTCVNWFNSSGDLMINVSDGFDVFMNGLSQDVDSVDDLVDSLSKNNDLLS